MEISLFKLVVILAIVLVLFGGSGKLSGLMGDIGKGIRSLKHGMKGDEVIPPAQPKQLSESNKDPNA